MLKTTAGMGAYRPSMMIDRLQGSPLELAAIYAQPLQQATRSNTPMPRVAMLYALLQATEQPL
jgi:2-dehydropantoate 2-reductase